MLPGFPEGESDLSNRLDTWWEDRLFVSVSEDREIILRYMEGLGLCSHYMEGVTYVVQEYCAFAMIPHLDLCAR